MVEEVAVDNLIFQRVVFRILTHNANSLHKTATVCAAYLGKNLPIHVVWNLAVAPTGLNVAGRSLGC